MGLTVIQTSYDILQALNYMFNKNYLYIIAPKTAYLSGMQFLLCIIRLIVQVAPCLSQAPGT